MNIYEQQIKNKRLTWVILFVFIIFFLIIGLGFDYFYLSYTQTKYINDTVVIKNEFVPLGTIASFFISVIVVINAFSNGIKMIVSATGARPANYNDLKEKQFINVVDEMSIAAGIPRPACYIVPDSDLNAFATGFSPDKSYVFTTQGLLDQLNREELQSVIAHEISHIRFYDIRLMTLSTVLINAIAMISDTIIRSSKRSSYSSASRNRRGGGGVLFIIWIILVILAPIISRMMAMAISRTREYLADAGASELTRNPKALISALEKIRKSIKPTQAIKESVAHLCIADPRGSLIEEKTGFISDLFSTHPPMEKRILALKLMAYEQNKNN